MPFQGSQQLGLQVAIIQVLQDRPPGDIEMLVLSTFLVPNLVHHLGECLQDVEPIVRHLGVGQVLGNPTQEGLTDVADQLDDVARVAARCHLS